MKLYCEVVVGDVLPALRALITNELIKKFNLTQREVAEKLGVTQPAISQYGKFLRGEKGKELQKNKKVISLVEEFSEDISNGKISPEDAASKILEISHMIVDKKIVYPEEGIAAEKVPCTICFK